MMKTYETVMNIAVCSVDVHAAPVRENVGDTTGTVDKPHVILTAVWRWTEAEAKQRRLNNTSRRQNQLCRQNQRMA